jgi:hypothetical protein
MDLFKRGRDILYAEETERACHPVFLVSET